MSLRLAAEHAEKIVIYVVLFTILVLMAFFLWYAVEKTTLSYKEGIGVAKQYYNEFSRDGGTTASFRPDISLLYILNYTRSSSFAIMKFAALFLGYIIVVVGCLFVLYGAQAFYKLKIDSKEVKSALETTSPGLVLITLGISLVAIALFTRSEVATQVEWLYHPKPETVQDKQGEAKHADQPSKPYPPIP